MTGKKISLKPTKNDGKGDETEDEGAQVDSMRGDAIGGAEDESESDDDDDEGLTLP